MLEVTDLEVAYGAVRAVQGVSFTLEAGNVVALVGPNGAGKSTTVMAIAGGKVPAAGTIVFDGQSIVGEPAEKIVRRGISLVPEDRRVFERLTVEENLKLGRTPRRKHPDDGVSERIYQLFPILYEYRPTLAGKLSGGEQQMLAIGRALMAEPRLLLLDEPSLGLAPQVVDLVFDALLTLKQQGTTILLIEQNATRALEVADRLHVVRNGRIQASGTAKEFAASGRLGQEYLGFDNLAEAR